MSLAQSTHDSARLTRRTTLGAGLLTLAACTPGNDPSGRATAGATPVLTDAEYDQRLVDGVALATAAALDHLEQMVARFGDASGTLAPLVALHQAHLAALAVTTRPQAPATGVGPTQARARQRLATLESTLQQATAAAATNARSGQLARVLASMSAGVAQHAAALAGGAR